MDKQIISDFISEFYSSVLRGESIFIIDKNMISRLRLYAVEVYNTTPKSHIDIVNLERLIKIGNIVYNNTDLDDDSQPIDNDLYDLLLENYKLFNPNFQVGAMPIHFDLLETAQPVEAKPLIVMLDPKKVNNMLYRENLFDTRYSIDFYEPQVNKDAGYSSDKKYRDVAHGSLDLVGTLDKCKYVLNAQAKELGVFEDPNVKILERDFFQNQFYRGIVASHRWFRMVLELKYDGVSVEASIKNGIIVRAASRGDTGADLATDLTPIFYGYQFKNLPKNAVLDCKFEAVMTYRNLDQYNKVKGKSYKNCRSAISGLISSNDGYLYQDFISLVPLKIAPSSLEGESTEWVHLDRVEEINFMNEYLLKDVPMKWAYVEGHYSEVLFLIKKFVDEAEYARPVMDFMYDGIVVSYMDQDLIDGLGRENFVNKYSIAVKFNALRKITRFLNYTFNVGQDGVIVPMFHYDPVNFLGTTHTKSTASSYARFIEYQLKEGDLVRVEYRNDVMPYVTPMKSLDENLNNMNPIVPFPTECPCCKGPVVISESGMSAKCVNIACLERNVQRAANMLQKMGVKDFSEATIMKLNVYFLTDMAALSVDQLKEKLGEANSIKFYNSIYNLITTPVYDYVIVGALGFTGIAQDTWKKILSKYPLPELIKFFSTTSKVRTGTSKAFMVKGIGDKTLDTIAYEFPYFMRDLLFITNYMRTIPSAGLATMKKIRVTGFRDEELMQELCSMGYDASDKGVTKDTALLLIPSKGFHSSKMDKVGANTMVLDVNEFKSDINHFLQYI